MRVFVVMLLALVCASPSFAQTGSLQGTVVDSLRAPIVGASVEISGPGVTSTVQSGPEGQFVFTGLSNGVYELTVSMAGFTTQRRPNTGVFGDRVTLPPLVLPLATVADTVVITATRAETTLVDAPATMSVVGSTEIATAASQNYGDLLRTVPGLNVVQLSARDFNLVSRQATYTLSNSQLVLVDGRSLYQDFFGFVMWDVLPNNTGDIQQIEVVRGPASAVWGANAMTGVVNVITKSPRETPGVDVTFNAGFLNRNAGSTKGKGLGGIFGSNASVSQILNDRWAYRVSAGYYRSDAYARPVGTIPVVADPREAGQTVGGAPYPTDGTGAPGTAFINRGTSQPKFDMRFDQELSNGNGRLSYQGGVAGTDGIVHTGLGPFDIQPGSNMSYAKVNYERQGLHVNAFGNFVDVRAPNLLLTDPATSKPLQLDFTTQTYDVEIRDIAPIGSKQVVTFGGNVRRNLFDLTVAPQGKNRTELGGFVEDTIILDRAILTAGARLDKFGNLDKPVFSPRLSATLKPASDHAIRFSFNRAFRAPSVVNNYLDTAIVSPVDLRSLSPLLPDPLKPFVANPFPLVVRAVGSELPVGSSTQTPLVQEQLTAYEAAYTGTIAGRTTVGAAIYANDLDNSVSFTALSPTLDPYTAANPPPGWQLPGAVLTQMAALGVYLPRTAFTYLNLGPIRQKGAEFSIDHRINSSVSVSSNYSWQARPVILKSDRPFPAGEFALPPTNRVNINVVADNPRYLGSASINYTGKAFWSDVLTSPYHGYTDAFTLVNVAGGLKWKQGKVTTMVKVVNLLNQDIQQHVFGDILKQSVTFEVRLHR